MAESKMEKVLDAIVSDDGDVVFHDPDTTNPVPLEKIIAKKFGIRVGWFTTLKITVERLPTVQEKIDQIAEIIKVAPSSLGGNLRGFWFEEGDRELLFGYANGVLGYQLSKIEGDTRQGESTGKDLGNYGSTVLEECQLIVKTLAEKGFECEEIRKRLTEYVATVEE